MPKTVKITCDNCEKDLTTVESGYDEFRLCLSSEMIHNTSQFRYASFPIKNKLTSSSSYFCDGKCLKEWLEKVVRL